MAAGERPLSSASFESRRDDRKAGRQPFSLLPSKGFCAAIYGLRVAQQPGLSSRHLRFKKFLKIEKGEKNNLQWLLS